MRVIKLTRGAGNGVDRACLMTASNMLIGRGQDGDNNSCVCPLLRAFILRTNDAIPEDLLGELYGPLVWEIIGTRNDDIEVLRARAYAFADWACREVLPLVLDAQGLYSEAASCRQLSPVVDQQTASAADMVVIAAYAAKANTVSSKSLKTARVKTARTKDAYAPANYAATIVTLAAVDAGDTVWSMCPEIIRRVAAIGDKRPVECVISAEQLAEALEV